MISNKCRHFGAGQAGQRDNVNNPLESFDLCCPVGERLLSRPILTGQIKIDNGTTELFLLKNLTDAVPLSRVSR